MELRGGRRWGVQLQTIGNGLGGRLTGAPQVGVQRHLERPGFPEQEFKLTSNAVVRMGAKTLTADDLSSHQGQNIKVRYTVTDSDKMADSITIADTPHHGGKGDSHK